MKKLATLITAVLCIAAAPAFADDDNRPGWGRGANWKAMDANGDGMLSKDEFMRFHEKMWDQMKKNSSGMVDMKDFPMHGPMMWWSDDKDDKKDKAAKPARTDKDK